MRDLCHPHIDCASWKHADLESVSLKLKPGHSCVEINIVSISNFQIEVSFTCIEELSYLVACVPLPRIVCKHVFYTLVVCLSRMRSAFVCPACRLAS